MTHKRAAAISVMIGLLAACAMKMKQESPMIFRVSDGVATLDNGSAKPVAVSNERPAALWPAALLQISTTEAFSKHVILVDKKQRKLMVFERDGETIREIEELPADIGKSDGDKKRANDRRTPEGIYFFEKRLAPPAIPFATYGRMAFTTDYPNLFDKRQGKTGSGIWLHSIPDTTALTRGSRGCVVIRNDALERVQNWIQLKQTPIIIYDQVEYLTHEEHERRRREMNKWLETWKAAWESKSIDAFLSYYAPDFSAQGFPTYKDFETHKRRVFQNAASIKVTLSQPYLLLYRDQLIVKTLQKFESNLYQDYGVKTIHAIRSDSGGYKIISEEWVPADEKGLAKTAQLLGSEEPAPVMDAPRRPAQIFERK